LITEADAAITVPKMTRERAPKRSFAMLTTAPGPDVAPYHNRQAVVLRPNDVVYVADSESRDGRTNIGQLTLAQTGYGFNPSCGIRIGSAVDGSVEYFIPDACPYPYPAGSSMAEGVDFKGTSAARIFPAMSENLLRNLLSGSKYCGARAQRD
jgi:hypothetical protein